MEVKPRPVILHSLTAEIGGEADASNYNLDRLCKVETLYVCYDPTGLGVMKDSNNG